MYVRAPKHFKAGKQFSFYFNSNFKYKLKILQKNSVNFLKQPAQVLYNSKMQFLRINQTSITVSRITLKSKFYFIFLAGVIFFQLIVNAIIFSFVFWLLTFIAKYTYSNKYYDYKLNFYECGFKNITKKKPIIELNFITMLLFLLIYDGEFLILIPFCLNTNVYALGIYCFFLFFILWFLLTLAFDYIYLTLSWQVIV